MGKEHTGRLLGELIGLARATEGNEHLISESVTAVIIRCLAASVEELPEEKLEQLLQKVEAEKRRMVPNCFSCASPCGRNNAFPLSKLLQEEPTIRALKQQLLTALQTLAAKNPAADPDIFYTGLIAVGIEGIDPKFPEQILGKIETSLKAP